MVSHEGGLSPLERPNEVPLNTFGQVTLNAESEALLPVLGEDVLPCVSYRHDFTVRATL